MIELSILALISGGATVVCVWAIRHISYERQWLVLPRKDRWHGHAVARYGGVGMVLPFAIGNIFLLVQERFALSTYFFFFIGSLLVFSLGFLDDIIRFNPATKLIGQIIAVSVPIAAGLIIPLTPWDAINILVSYFWFIGIINAMNIVDNMDGLAAGIALIASITLFVIMGSAAGFTATLPLRSLAIFLAIPAGFLLFNLPPASIFMGDAGSLFLGYVLAALTIPNSLNGFFGKPSAALALLVPATVLSIPIFESVLVTLLRLLHKIPPFRGGKDHSSHRLVGLGFSEGKAVALLYGMCAIGGVIAVALHVVPTLTAFFAVLYALFLCAVGIYLGRVKVYKEPDALEEKQQWTPLVVEIFHKRRIFEVLLDIILIAASYYFAHYLRFESMLVPLGQLANYIQSLPLVIAFSLFGFFVGGIYRGFWHFISVRDIGRYLSGVILGVSLSVFSIVLLYRFHNFSRSVFVIFGVLLFLLVMGGRVIFRIFDDVVQKRTLRGQKTRVLIYGAGMAGKLLYEECGQNPLYRKYAIVGFVDDDKEKHLRTIYGITIYDRSRFLSLIPKHAKPIHEVWVSSSRIAGSQVVALINDIEKSTMQRIIVQKFTAKVEEITS